MMEQEMKSDWERILMMAENGMDCRGGIRGRGFHAQTDGYSVRILLASSQTFVHYSDFVSLIDALEEIGPRRITTAALQEYGLNTPTYVLGLYNALHEAAPMDERYNQLVDHIHRAVPGTRVLSEA